MRPPAPAGGMGRELYAAAGPPSPAAGRKRELDQAVRPPVPGPSQKPKLAEGSGRTLSIRT